MARTPLAQFAHILGRRERRTAALIGFENDPGDVGRLDAKFAQCAFEAFERGVRGAEPIRKGNLDETGVEVADPLLERRNPSGLLRTQGSSMKRLVIRNDDILRAAAYLHSVRAAQLDYALHRLRPGGEKKDLL